MRKDVNNGTEFRRSIAHYLASLIDRRDFAGAIEYYEANRSELDKAGGDLAGSVLRQAARAYASAGNHTVALKLARKAQNLIAKAGDSELLAEVFLTIGNILRDTGELREAEKAFRDAESIFRRNDSDEGQSRALNLLAGLYFRQNDFRNSLATLMDAIVIAKKLGDRKKLAFMMGNIGRIHTFNGNFKDAIKHIRINLELSIELSDKLETARAYLSLGYVYLQQAEYEQAEKSLDAAGTILKALDSKRDLAIYQTYLGELFYKTDRLDESQSALEYGLEIAKSVAPHASLSGRVMRHLAELNVCKGNYRHARHFAVQSLAIMTEADVTAEVGALTKLVAIIDEAQKRNDAARSGYIRAIEILDESGVRFEKASAILAAGQSELFSSRQRMNYLFRAEEYYTRTKLVHHLKRVEQLLGSAEQQADQSKFASRRQSSNSDFRTNCQSIIQFKEQMATLGRVDLPVLLTGETGVGKDHLARCFHATIRPDRPFIAINCASVPETLLESELFGYSRGAFTGADRDKTGLFVAASGGVLFLDEIGDMPVSLQAKLLGVLERRKVTPLGSTHGIDIDIKLIAATNCDLDGMVENGSFRRDLYYRLSGITFRIPALRERKEDIPLLLNHFLGESQLDLNGESIPVELVRMFLNYDWPGNTRELFNKVKRLEVMVEMVNEGDLVELTRSLFATEGPALENNSLFERVEQFERELIHQALLAADGNKSHAARLLGIHEATVRTKLKRYGISVNMAN